MQEIILKITHFERGLSKKIFKKSEFYFFFRAQFFLINKIMKNKRGLKLVTSLPSGCKTSSEEVLY